MVVVWRIGFFGSLEGESRVNSIWYFEYFG